MRKKLSFLCPICGSPKEFVRGYVGALMGASVPALAVPMCSSCADTIQMGEKEINSVLEAVTLFGFSATAHVPTPPCSEWDIKQVATAVIENFDEESKPSMALTSDIGLFCIWIYEKPEISSVDTVVVLREIHKKLAEAAKPFRDSLEDEIKEDSKLFTIPLTSKN